MRRLSKFCSVLGLLGTAISSPRCAWALQPDEIKITQPPAGRVFTHRDSVAVQIQFGTWIDPSSIHLTVDNGIVFPQPFPAYDGPDTQGLLLPSLAGYAFGLHHLGVIAATRDGRFVLDALPFTIVPTPDEVVVTFAGALELLREGEVAGAFSHTGAALIRESLL